MFNILNQRQNLLYACTDLATKVVSDSNFQNHYYVDSTQIYLFPLLLNPSVSLHITNLLTGISVCMSHHFFFFFSIIFSLYFQNNIHWEKQNNKCLGGT